MSIAKPPGMFSKALVPGTILLTVPGVLLKFNAFHTGYGGEALLYGIGMLGAAFILSWAAEVVQMDISQGFALAILAFIAVLPEYAVDMVFAWKAAEDPSYAPLALANMTGANRLLIGLGWPMVLVLFFIRSKKKALQLDKEHSTEVFYMACATVYAFSIPFKGSLTIFDAIILIAIFTMYLVRTAKSETHEPELVGPSAIIGKMSNIPRRTIVYALFAFSGTIIFLSAEPFAHSLVEFGRESGIDEFLLVQWLAPLASESPEFMIAGIWAFRGQAQAAMGALISSKVNQWTLLVGTLPIVYSIAMGKISALPLDMRQDHEIWLTAGQSIFAIAILANLRMSWYGAVLLFVLFMVQLIVSEIRMEIMWIYIVFGVLILVRDRRVLLSLAKIGLKFK
ncbi:MAG: sodium:calcium antiporter [candidate division Zixibacteria bacterium]|nr:sodium:calcium antiporter [candidate division Zixibacteria bacterium]